MVQDPMYFEREFGILQLRTSPKLNAVPKQFNNRKPITLRRIEKKHSKPKPRIPQTVLKLVVSL